jgi:hypothetical protein
VRCRSTAGWPPTARAIAFAIVSLIFAYTTVANVAERPDGVKIAACFIAAILAVSFLSRLYRAFELRVTGIDADEVALGFLRECGRRQIRLVANEPGRRDAPGVDRGQPDRQLRPLPDLRAGRGGPGDPRDDPPGRAGPQSPPARPRRLSRACRRIVGCASSCSG